MRTHPALLVALLALAGVGATCNKGREVPGTPTKEQPPHVPEDKTVVQAPKITEIPGVEARDLPGSVRLDFWRLMNETFCYCGCPRTLAACLQNRESCSCVKCSERMTDFILDLYRSGASTEDVEFTLLEGFAEGYNGPPREIPNADQPKKGPDGAKYTIVEYADFRCGHCKAVKPVLDKLVASRNDVQLVYHYYPLSDSEGPSQLAAEAAEEARKQGKFWEMSEALFENQLNIDRDTLGTFAKKAGLDMAQFDKAMKARVHKDKVLENKKMGQSLAIESTPSIFVNGRRFGLPRTLEYLEFRLDIEAERGRCE